VACFDEALQIKMVVGPATNLSDVLALAYGFNDK
jgi:hypothetical protein